MSNVYINNVKVKNVIDDSTKKTLTTELNSLVGFPNLMGSNSKISIGSDNSCTDCKDGPTPNSCCTTYDDTYATGFDKITCKYNATTLDIDFVLDLDNLVNYELEVDSSNKVTTKTNCLLVLMTNGLNQQRVLLADPQSLSPNDGIELNKVRSWPIKSKMSGTYSIKNFYKNTAHPNSFTPSTLQLVDNSAFEVSHFADTTGGTKASLLNSNKYYMTSVPSGGGRQFQYYTSSTTNGITTPNQDYKYSNSIYGLIDGSNMVGLRFNNFESSTDSKNPDIQIFASGFNMYYPFDATNPIDERGVKLLDNNLTSNYMYPGMSAFFNNGKKNGAYSVEFNHSPTIQAVNKSKIFTIHESGFKALTCNIDSPVPNKPLDITKSFNVQVEIGNIQHYDIGEIPNTNGVMYVYPVMTILYEVHNTSDISFMNGYTTNNSNVCVFKSSNIGKSMTIKDQISNATSLSKINNFYSCCITSISVKCLYYEDTNGTNQDYQNFSLKYWSDHQIDANMNNVFSQIKWQNYGARGSYQIQQSVDDWKTSPQQIKFQLVYKEFVGGSSPWKIYVLYQTGFGYNYTCPFTTFKDTNATDVKTNLIWNYGKDINDPKFRDQTKQVKPGDPVPSSELEITSVFEFQKQNWNS